MPFDASTWTPPLVQAQHDLNLLREMRAGISAPGGWCQGVGTRADGARCILGWAGAVTGSDRREAARFLSRVMPFGGSGLIAFNDEVGRTQAEVVALFDRAIARLEASYAV